MRLLAIARVVAGAAAMAVLGASGSVAAQSGANAVLVPADMEKLLPATVYPWGQSASVQARDSRGVKFADGHYMMASLVGTSGYSSGVAGRYQLEQAAVGYREFLTATLDEVGNSRIQIGDYVKASALYDEALALTPDAPAVHRDFASAALEAGDLARAEREAGALVSDSANDSKSLAEGHRILGRVLHKMNRDQEARKELEAAVAINPSFANEYELAVVCLNLDDEQCAVQIFDGLEASAGDRPALHMQFGRAYANSNFTPRAVVEFKKAIAEDPHYPGAHYCVAAALLAAGEDEKTFAEAETELKEELAISPNDFMTYAALGKVAANYHRTAEAERYLKHAIVLNPKNPDAYLYLGQMYFDANRTTEAEANLRQAIKLTTDTSRNYFQIQKAHFLLGRILMQQHREEEAHAEMQIAHALSDKAFNKERSKLAGVMTDKGPTIDPSSAQTEPTTSSPASPRAADPAAVSKQRAFERQVAPAIADSYNNLGAITASANNYADAVKYFKRAVAWNPSLAAADHNLGRAAFMASDFADAAPALSRSLRSHPGDSGIRSALAMSHFMIHQYSACIDDLKAAGDSVKSNPQTQYIYAESLVKTGQVTLGKERLEALEAAHPEIAEVHRGLGEVAELRKDWQTAIKELVQAVQLNAKDPETHYDLGKAELAMGNTPGAIGELEDAVHMMPSEASYHEELATAYERDFRMADSEREHRAAKQLESGAAPTASGESSTEPKSPGR
jgi:tetratricopeptide (TPR) repeat protein